MARIVLSTIGSLGDLHPMIALALELRRRSHDIIINTWRGYEERIRTLGFDYRELRPDADIDDKELHRRAMDPRNGPEFVIKELVVGNIREMFQDLSAATADADLLITGEIVYAARSVAELSKIKWISTSLAPVSMFSADDPSVYQPWVEVLRPLPALFHRAMLEVIRYATRDWLDEYRSFRAELGLHQDHDPVFREKFSDLLHLAMFSKALARPQPDWHRPTLQTGFCFYDESPSAPAAPEVSQFLEAGEPPIIFTLGSAASLDAGSFFDESAKAAKTLGRRAMLIYGRDQSIPNGLSSDIAAFEFVPYSTVFPRAACVVHQAGVGTTGQALGAGVPQLIVPFSHDQFDNAARCRRAGVAEIIDREAYRADRAAAALRKILANGTYRRAAVERKMIVKGESGTKIACDAIEEVLSR